MKTLIALRSMVQNTLSVKPFAMPSAPVQPAPVPQPQAYIQRADLGDDDRAIYVWDIYALDGKNTFINGGFDYRSKAVDYAKQKGYKVVE